MSQKRCSHVVCTRTSLCVANTKGYHNDSATFLIYIQFYKGVHIHDISVKHCWPCQFLFIPLNIWLKARMGFWYQWMAGISNCIIFEWPNIIAIMQLRTHQRYGSQPESPSYSRTMCWLRALSMQTSMDELQGQNQYRLRIGWKMDLWCQECRDQCVVICNFAKWLSFFILWYDISTFADHFSKLSMPKLRGSPHIFLTYTVRDRCSGFQYFCRLQGKIIIR